MLQMWDIQQIDKISTLTVLTSKMKNEILFVWRRMSMKTLSGFVLNNLSKLRELSFQEPRTLLSTHFHSLHTDLSSFYSITAIFILELLEKENFPIAQISHSSPPPYRAPFSAPIQPRKKNFWKSVARNWKKLYLIQWKVILKGFSLFSISLRWIFFYVFFFSGYGKRMVENTRIILYSSVSDGILCDVIWVQNAQPKEQAKGFSSNRGDNPLDVWDGKCHGKFCTRREKGMGYGVRKVESLWEFIWMGKL